MRTTEIASSLKAAKTSDEFDQIIRDIQRRRAEIRERLAQIEPPNGVEFRAATEDADMARVAELRAEADELDDEIGALYHLQQIADKRYKLAIEQEAPSKAAAALERVKKATPAAEKARAAWYEARDALKTAIDELIAARDQMRPDRRDEYTVPADAFERVADVLFVAEPANTEQLYYGRRRLRAQIVAPPPPKFVQFADDVAEQVHAIVRRR